MAVSAPACRALAALAAVALAAAVPALAVTGVDGDAAWALAFVVPLYATGVFAFLKAPDLPIARLLLVAACLWTIGLALGGVLEGVYDQEGRVRELWPLAALVGAGETAAIVLSAAFVALFPTGTAERRFERWAVAAMLGLIAVAVLDLFTSPTLELKPDDGGEISNPIEVGALSSLNGTVDGILHLVGLAFLAAIVMLFLRYRRASQEQRGQIRLVLFVALTGVVLAQALWALSRLGAPALETAGTVVALLCIALLPFAVLVAILLYRLLEIDILIRKSLVYGAL
jgi:hypothetical protein